MGGRCVWLTVSGLWIRHGPVRAVGPLQAWFEAALAQEKADMEEAARVEQQHDAAHDAGSGDAPEEAVQAAAAALSLTEEGSAWPS